MAFPTTSVISTFTGADEAPLSEGGVWAGNIFGSGNSCQLLSNQAAPNGAFSNSRLVATSGPDLEVYEDFATLVSGVVGLLWRITNPGATVTGYEAFANLGTNTVGVYRIDDESTEVQLGADFSATFANGDALGISHIGSTISVYQRVSGVWSLLGTRTDATYNTAGVSGFGIDGSNRIDNFGGGTIAGGAAGILRQMMMHTV